VEEELLVFFTSVLNRGKLTIDTPVSEPPHPLDRGLGGHHSRCGSGGKHKEIPDPTGNRTPSSPSPVTTLNDVIQFY